MNAFLTFHVLVSLVGIYSGFIVVFGLVGSKVRTGWTRLFLWTTLATSLTGFVLPHVGFTPAIGVGVISVVLLFFAIFAFYRRKLFGGWRVVYVVTVVLAQFLNFFVLIAQSFQKISFLHHFAPTGKEPAFALAQGLALVFFIVLGALALRKFHPVAPLA